MFALGYENPETALGKLGSGGWVKASIDRGGGGLAGTSPAHIELVIGE